ncbi:MAG: group II intron reverse transcriptase/maturase [Phormidesmis sp.]
MNPRWRQPRYEWKTLPWRQIERRVFKLQRRIYRAEARNDRRTVRRLQRLMMRSRDARLLAVRRVTQDNRGKRTAGIDGKAKLNADERMQLAQQMSLRAKAKPVRRIWIAKNNGKEKRPLGIPVIAERALQALVKLALEPEWEAKFEPNSYGFRPGRGAHDAIGAIFNAIVRKPKYVLDADIAQCFDAIDHQALLTKVNASPQISRLIKGWLKAGVWQNGQWFASTAGTPQGGVLSPLLANIALHGMESYLESQFPPTSYMHDGKRIRLNTVQVIRYADDFVVLHPDLATVRSAKAALERWLVPMGLQLKPSKTRIVHTLAATEVDTGFDFLGFHIRQYPVSRYQRACGYKTLIKPSAASVKRHYQQLRHLVRKYTGNTQRLLIVSLNHCIRGWSHYFSTVVSNQAFARLDDQLKRALLVWTKRQRGKRNVHQTIARYWGIDRGMGWQFCSSDNLCLILHRYTPIRRHVKVRSEQSPFDGDWPYWATRRGRYPGTSARVASLLKRQAGRCAHCGLVFDTESLIEVHHRNQNRRDNHSDNLCVLHRHCHDQIHGDSRQSKRSVHDQD